MSETKTCPRCESANVSFHVPVGGSQAYYTCENGHKWGEELAQPPASPPFDPFVCEIADVIASGLRHHLRNSAREYLERLIKELDTA